VKPVATPDSGDSERSPLSAPASGFRWGPFTLRVPFVHTSIAWPELLQGIFVAGATGLGLVPLLQSEFGLGFEEAVACAFLQSMLISSSAILFGEPFAPGWITPAIPLVMMSVLAKSADGVLAYPTPESRFQLMTAVSLDFAALVLVLGLTGLGSKLIRWVPRALEGGIILGAALAALDRVFRVDAEKYLLRQPVSTIVAVAICLVLTFSLPLRRLAATRPWLRIIAGLGLLPGFIAAALVGSFVDGPARAGSESVREISYSIEWGVLIPPFADLFAKVSPFAIGWPSVQMFIAGIPLAIMGYVILFGDLIVGAQVLRQAMPARPDEKIDIDFDRSHLSISIRNVLMALFAPFFPTQGMLWTGVHVIIVQRWSTGRHAMRSIWDGISSYYVFGVPILYLFLPALTALRPLMGIALSLTLLLTGFACATLAMAIPRTPIERGVVLLIAVLLTVFANPWIGMLVGVLATFALVGFERDAENRS
jgi:hypothetical protein